MEGWEAIRARLLTLAALAEHDGDPQSAADIRAALERLDKCEAAVKRQGELLAEKCRQVEELERLEVTDVAGWCERAEAAEAEVQRLRDIISPGDAAAYEEGMAALEAKLARLEGLILDWDDCWRLDPFQDPGAVARGDEGLMAEVRRIRAQREQSKAHESDCPCVMCDPMQVRLNQQLRAQREEE